ncbi:MAG TPA: tetratricopeptide repeat protein, partial [Pyrinomonadaceae bacterium]|nr:tetratricopeptide repeat protein [Pyrinomonadaceae bacterium]
MSNDLTQEGIGNIGLQGISNSSINITQILGKSVEYKDLHDQLKTNEELLALIPEENLDKRIALSEKINQLKDEIKQFIKEVLHLAEEFDQIEIKTQRLEEAKEFYNKGEIDKATAIIESDIEQIHNEHQRLIRQRERFENNILPQLKEKSDEFFILAMSKQTDYADYNWFENGCLYFEKSIEAFPTKFNIFQYAFFLQRNNELIEAESYYQEFLTKFSNFIDLSDKAMVFNNLGDIHYSLSEHEDALKEYKKALEIYRNLAVNNPLTYLPDVATTLNNLGNLHRNTKEYEVAQNEYKEALEIFNKLAVKN